MRSSGPTLIRPTEPSDLDPPGLESFKLESQLRPCFLVLRAEGPAPSRDALEGSCLEIAVGDGAWEQRELGPDELRATLAALDPAALVIVPAREPAAGWMFELGLSRDRWLGLDELAAWIDPGGLGSESEALARSGRADASRLDQLEPTQLRRALSSVIARLIALPELALAAVALSWRQAQSTLGDEHPLATRQLAAIFELADRPSVIGGPARLDGRLSHATGQVEGLELGVLAAPLGFERSEGAPLPEHALPSHTDDTRPLGEGELETIGAIFEQPRVGEAGVVLEPRPAQAAVARAVATTLGSGELCLGHAPTGTGKTLAYLVPAMLFALRNGVRVGVATYTRALQRQAHDRDVPLARALLAGAGESEQPRVAVLKGRQNYVCGRALGANVPRPEDGTAAALGFAHLLAFALTSPDGDLDQLPPIARTPLGGLEGAAAERARLVRAVRGRTGCCRRRNDRERCGADAARHRAERSHVVLTNHAFALARREFFAHLVFDECEHLHDQAHSAFSHVVPTAELEDQLVALRAGSGRRRRRTGRGPLDRLLKVVPMGSAAFQHAQAACDQQEAALDSLAGLEEAGRRFLEWREAQGQERSESERHSLLREYVEARVDPELNLLHVGLTTALSRLDVALATIAEELDQIAEGGGRRLRQPLERARAELFELSSGVDAWLPTVDGATDFRPETFYDLERGPRGRGVSLHARVLLPNEFLGRYMYPDLRSAMLLSATTFLAGGFDAANGYLGLDRAAEPAEEEDREPSVVRHVRAPESFDYGRVLVGVPTDAPSYRVDKQGWLDYTARFCLHLATRTRGRTLVLATNAADALELHNRLATALARVGVDCLAQGADSRSTEQLAADFRASSAALLIGLDTFWFGADFPGQALEYVVIPKLPYGVPDRYHHAQCAVLGTGAQRKRIYMPRALARFRQGFGRLMRRATDSGAIFLLDTRVTEPRHKVFLRELPIEDDEQLGGGARLLRASTDRVLRAAFEHMQLEAWDLDAPFADTRL
jgi:ATP-dependent DNA helicase DinG